MVCCKISIWEDLEGLLTLALDEIQQTAGTVLTTCALTNNFSFCNLREEANEGQEDSAKVDTKQPHS